jgi:hypothetical protein
VRKWLLLLCAAVVVPGEASGGKMELPPVEVRFTVRGAYDIRKSEESIGREDFIRTSLSNNIAIYESVFEVIEGESTIVAGNNRLELEEDSGYPRSYYTQRRTRSPNGETMREVTVEMYANVAVVSERRDGYEGRREITLPTGCLFVEGNTAAHVALVLDRYDYDAGGLQTFRAFDPLGVAMTDVTLESAGDSIPSEAGAESGGNTLRHLHYQTGGSPRVDVYVDQEGRVASIAVRAGGLEYALVSFERKPEAAAPAK